MLIPMFPIEITIFMENSVSQYLHQVTIDGRADMIQVYMFLLGLLNLREISPETSTISHISRLIIHRWKMLLQL